MESIWLEINFPNTENFVISVWYWPPSTSKFLPTNFNELLRNSLIKASSENKETILIGDFNIIYQKVDDSGELKSIFTLFELKQIIKITTRVADKTESLINLVFTNVLLNITLNDVYALSFSDHDLIGFSRKQNRMKTAPKTIHCRNYRRYDHGKLKDDLKNLDWSPVYISHSISDLLKAFNRMLTGFFDRHAPFATIRASINIFPCLTVELKSEMDYRDVLQRKLRKTKTTRITNVRETKLTTWFKELNNTTTKTCWIKTPKTLLHSGEHWKVYFPPNRNQNLLVRHSK